MAVATGFSNQEAVKTATIELVNLSTPNDSRHPQHLDINLSGNGVFPYQKTRSGAINSGMSPFERQRHFWQMSGASALFLFMAIVAKKPF